MSLQILNDTRYSDQTYTINGGIEELNSRQDTLENTVIKTGEDAEDVFIRDTVDISEEGMGRLQKLIEPGTENFKSGYYEKLSKASEAFKKAFKSQLTNSGTGIAYKDIDYSSVDNIVNKYNEIHKSIEDNYSGQEKDDKLKELSDAYAFTIHKNIIKPVELQVDQALSDAENKEIMQGFLQRVNEYHSTLIGGLYSTEVVGLNDILTVSDNIKQYHNLIDVLKDLETDVIRNKNIDTERVKESLHNIISTIIEKVGTEAQKNEYAAIDVMV